MATEQRTAELEEIYQAVTTYGRIEFEGLARRVIHQLQRMPASGIFGDDFRYRSIWDEWCHEVQEGPHELLEDAWDDAVLPFIDATLESVPAHVEALLTVYSTGQVPQEPGSGSQLAVWGEDLQGVLREKLERMAMNRELDHLRS